MKESQSVSSKNSADLELKAYRRRHLLLAGALLLAMFIGAGLLGRFFQTEVATYTQLIADVFGFWGLAGLLFVSDSLLSPLPPDVILLIIAKSGLREQWPILVTILGLISTFAGSAGWMMGRFLISTSWAPRFLTDFSQRQAGFVTKFGKWAVILGALTPLPFSVTCWAAGFLKMPYRPFALAASTRFFRIVFYYLAIHYSNWLQ